MTTKVNTSILKATEILSCFETHEELGITELTTLTGYSKSTIYDLVRSLVETGLMKQNPNNKKYALGLRLFELGGLYNQRNPLNKIAAVYCKALSDKWQGTVHLTIPDEGDVIYIGKYENPNTLISASHVGKRLPMIATGVGKAILANQDEAYLQKYVLNKPFTQFTPNTITNEKDLRIDLEKTRERGYAIDDEEIMVGLTCYAAPIMDRQNKVIAAISISKLTVTLNSNNEQIAQDIKETANLISSNIGY